MLLTVSSHIYLSKVYRLSKVERKRKKHGREHERKTERGINSSRRTQEKKEKGSKRKEERKVKKRPNHVLFFGSKPLFSE